MVKEIKIIWRFIDGKAGHEKQSQALINEIKKQTKCKVFEIGVKKLRHPILNILFGRYSPEGNLPCPDIAIGAGHQTHLHLLAVKRSFGAKIVVIMKPSLPLKFFDLCVIPKHDDVKEMKNIFTTQAPLVDFNRNTKKQNIGLFLIGGPSKHYYWDTKLILQKIKRISKQSKIRKFLLTTSRRTPVNFISELNNLSLNNMRVCEYSKIDDDWLDKHINKVKNIWVTNDSFSMICEALASGAHTDILDLEVKRNSKLSKEINEIKRNLRKKIVIQNEAKRVALFIKKLWF